MHSRFLYFHVKETQNTRDHEQGEQGGNKQTAGHSDAEGLYDVRPFTKADSNGKHSAHSGKHCYYDRGKAYTGSLHEGIDLLVKIRPDFNVEIYHYNSVVHDNTGQHDRTEHGIKAQRGLEQEQAEDNPDEPEGNSNKDHQGNCQ